VPRRQPARAVEHVSGRTEVRERYAARFIARDEARRGECVSRITVSCDARQQAAVVAADEADGMYERVPAERGKRYTITAYEICPVTSCYVPSPCRAVLAYRRRPHVAIRARFMQSYGNDTRVTILLPDAAMPVTRDHA